MKKLLSFFALASILVVANSCKESDGDIITPLYDLKKDRILVKLDVPEATPADDVVSISGAFNGNDSWELECSPENPLKWYIYLNPKDFVDGKTLADGYHFVSTALGEEVTKENKPVVRTQNMPVGTRISAKVEMWAGSYEAPKDFALYISNNTGWESVAMYAWGDAEVFGGWPGVLLSEKKTINGIEFLYYKLPESILGKNVNIILNNNGGGEQFDAVSTILDHDIIANATYAGDRNGALEDYYCIYVCNEPEWSDLAGHFWGESIGTQWPGLKFENKASANGKTYQFVVMGLEHKGTEMQGIFSGTSDRDANRVTLPAFTLDKSRYYTITGPEKYVED